MPGPNDPNNPQYLDGDAAGSRRDRTERMSYGGELGGANAATARYQGLGAAAAQRAAYQQDFGNSDQSRGAQQNAMGMMQGAAMGNQPSKAELLGKQMADQGLASQMAMAGSARGGGLAQAAAMHQAMSGQAAYTQQAQNQMAGIRADEMANARSAYFGAASGMRNADLQQTGMQTQNEQFQRGLNQQGQMGYEGMGQTAQTAQLDAAAKQQQIEEGHWEHQTATDAHATDRETGVIAGAVGAAGSVLGHVFSDERTKEPVGPEPQRYGLLDEGFDGSDAWSRGMSNKTYAPPEGSAKPKDGGGGWMSKLGGGLAAAASGWSKGMTSDEKAKTGVSSPTFDVLSDGGGGMNVMGSLKAHSDFATQFARNAGSDPTSYSDERAKDGVMYLGPEPNGKQARWDDAGPRYVDEQANPLRARISSEGGSAPSKASVAHAATSEKGGMSLDEMAAWADRERAKVAEQEANSLKSGPAIRGGDSILSGQGRMRPGELPAIRGGDDGRIALPGPQHDRTLPGPQRSLPGPQRGEAGLAQAARSMAPAAYAYKPEFRPPDQAPGEPNIGPIAQNMAADPMSRTAVKRDPSTGMLTIDRDKAQKLTMGLVASQQRQLDQLRAELARRGG